MKTTTKFDIDSTKIGRFVHLQPKVDSHTGAVGKSMILLYGMFGGFNNFEQLAEMLVDTGVEVWIPELPMFDLGSNVSVQALGDWLYEFITIMKITNPILLGNSMGGHLALDLCIRKQLTVQALVLTGSSGLFEEHFGESTPKRFDREYVTQRIEQTFVNYEVTDALVDAVMDILGDRKKLMRMVTLARSTHKYNMRSYLSEIQCPVQLIWGKQDVITPPEVAKEFQKLIADARLYWIDNCGHAPMMEHPKRFFVELKAFIDRLDHYQPNITSNKKSNYKSSTI